MDFILTERALTAFVGETVYTVHGDDDRFEEAVDCVRNDDEYGLVDLLKPIEAVRAFLSASGRVEISEHDVKFDGKIVNNYMATRILQHYRAGFPVEPIINFMINVYDNPSKNAVDQLLQFLEFGELPITPDGCFLAYKRVGRNGGYLDSWSGTIDNSVGQHVSMPRNEVQDDPDITCSYGLHFCSLDYVRNFWGAHLMVLKINPKDVVSIPTDYNNTKGRCCAYDVVGELDETPRENNHWGAPMIDVYETPAVEDIDDDAAYYPFDNYPV
jgi:hypothetical protein